ncbi:SanA/YdcF family protein [Salinicola rhizosphaerae]|uniref:Vancomycin high temperature exclusion protein n=1 Tax=Salinicola rhizosphaerae TaxID=1443141 RepID=A0ABQ3E6Y7_9GAMM|nr:ElyC/SanA/YdcF family protein [Salinicola rhizosphaerae]GHB28046.1 vancomycin high temperature exclusion protein [Salinicola rhizosphaerae]
MTRLLKGLVKAMLAGVLLLVLGVVGINVWILAKTQPRIEHDVLLCKPQPVGLVFGTAQWLRKGGPNPYYRARMETAAELLRLHHLQHLLLSGDNRTRYYNEPISMWRSLRHRNVADADMTLDYAGFSTFDSVVRAREVFGADRLMLISQAWHLPRALFIADSLGIDATGCAVPDDGVGGEWQLRVREWLARAATFGDLYFWGREPYFLGPFEPIRLSPP